MRPKERTWLHLLLLLLTLAATTQVGADHYLSFLSDFNTKRIIVRSWAYLMTGFWFSLTVLAILGAHEMGHYLACRHHGVSASLPYFIPAPLTMIGTFGAFIRIRAPIYLKRQLFDIGIAGPIAGFVVAVPLLVWGLSLSRVTRVPVSFPGAVELGEPLLFQAVAHLLFGSVPQGYSLNLHPVGLGAWFGLLATLLNLFPIGQLDGGHIAYAVFGRHAKVITVGTVAVAVGLTFVSMSWLLWTVLAVAMLFAFGLQHPQVIDEHEPLDSTRRWLALAALAMFVLCFTPAPIQPLDLLHR